MRNIAILSTVIASTATTTTSSAYLLSPKHSNNRNVRLRNLAKVQNSQKVLDDVTTSSNTSLADQILFSQSQNQSNANWVADHIIQNTSDNGLPVDVTRTVAPTASKKISPNRKNKVHNENMNSSQHTTSAPALRRLDHRHSSSDFLYNLSTLRNSSVLKEISHPVMSITIWSVCLSSIHLVLKMSNRVKLANAMTIPHGPHGLIAKVLGLLLVFKTNSAYGRFQEGRRIWENIHNHARDLKRMLTLYESSIGSKRVQRISNLLASFPYFLRHQMCPRCLTEEGIMATHPDDLLFIRDEIPDCDTRFDNSKSSSKISNKVNNLCCVANRQMLPWRLIEPSSMAACCESRNRSLWVCDRMASEVAGAPVKTTGTFTSRERLALLTKINALSSTIGQCERIHQTLVPVNYARHCLRALTIYLATLPLTVLGGSVIEIVKTGMITNLISWLMFGIYEIGYSIEDPFQGSIRLSILCENIRRDVLRDDFSAFHVAPVSEDDELSLFP